MDKIDGNNGLLFELTIWEINIHKQYMVYVVGSSKAIESKCYRQPQMYARLYSVHNAFECVCESMGKNE